jgi:hypothetical protein
MGYNTTLSGEFHVSPSPLSKEQVEELKKLKNEGHWKVSPFGETIAWDENSTNYEEEESVKGLERIIKLLKEWKKELRGKVTWKGEDTEDAGSIEVEKDGITLSKSPPMMPYKRKRGDTWEDVPFPSAKKRLLQEAIDRDPNSAVECLLEKYLLVPMM